MNFQVTVLKILVSYPGGVASKGLVERETGAWRITDKGREVLEFMEARSSCPVQISSAEVVEILEPAPRLPGTRTRRRRAQRRMARHRLRARAC